MDTITTEDKYFIPFFHKIPISFERGEGIYVWDEDGEKYIDFTSGWGVTCIGHASPVISQALITQSRKIIQNPASGLTYSPVRAKLLSRLSSILPGHLSRLFFSNSGAESNDAALKLARKTSGRPDIISTDLSFHGRTISAVSATGQAKHRDKFNPLLPNNKFVPFNDLTALEEAMDDKVAGVMLEPIQGEGGVNLPQDGYLKKVSDICADNGSYLIIDEIQTGFCRTGSMFAIDGLDLKVDFMTMAKGIAGGFPFGAFAVSEEVSQKIEIGDHGGTYCGNPLGCAVADAVIKYLVDNKIAENALKMGSFALETFQNWQRQFPELILNSRGKGLLIALEIKSSDTASFISSECLNMGLILNVTQGNIIRLFPALNITRVELEAGLNILEKALRLVAGP